MVLWVTVLRAFIRVTALTAVVSLGVSCSERSSSSSTTGSLPRPSSTAPRTTTTTSTSVPRPLSLGGLPILENREGSPDEVAILQRLLNATCCDRIVDGVWGERTDESLLMLRWTLDLDDGALDEELWETIYDAPPLRTGEVISDFGISIASSAVLLRQSEDSQEFTLAGSFGFEAAADLYRSRWPAGGSPQWERCTPEETETDATFRWLRTNEDQEFPGLEIRVVHVGGSRVDLEVTRAKAPSWTCGEPPATAPSTTNSTATTRPPQTTSTTSGQRSPSASSTSVAALCDVIRTVLGDFSSGLRVTQCETQDSWLIVQTNDVAEWTGFLQQVRDGEMTAAALYEMPAAAFSGALYRNRIDGALFEGFIFSIRDYCETVIEYRASDIAAASVALGDSEAAWYAAVQRAASNSSLSTLTIDGC